MQVHVPSMTRASVALLVLAACSAAPRSQERGPPEVICEAPRPEACIQQYGPVCADRDTGIRCITTPCDSTEQATYPNGCAACADPAVLGYRAGACTE